MPEKQVLVRMFFKTGYTETRPLSWVRFTTAEDFSQNSHVLKASFTEVVKSVEDEVYVAFTDQLLGIQVFLGEFVNARLERSKSRGQY